jgi:hypothetical protein
MTIPAGRKARAKTQAKARAAKTWREAWDLWMAAEDEAAAAAYKTMCNIVRSGLTCPWTEGLT